MTPADPKQPNADASYLSQCLARFERALEGGQLLDPKQICADRPDLLPQIERMLKVHGFLDRIDKTVAQVASTQNDPLPECVDRYRIVRRLGSGGFGTVYQAHDPQLDRTVALKVLRRAAGRDVELALHEARIVARLEHPGIVRVYDSGRTADGLCWITSQFIDGTDLAERMLRDRFVMVQAVELIIASCAALHFAHKAMIVHRDIKPSNILLNHTGMPFLTDFGLAMREQDYGQGGGYTGTPRYMSPEQARGEGHRVDGRSDIYSLGVVLYEMICGRVPFVTDRLTELFDQIQHRDPPPLRLAVEHLPVEIDRIVSKCLVKRASDRYATAQELADDLSAWLKLAQPSPGTAAVIGGAIPSIGTSSRAPRVVPKGLRAFEAVDADFFLRLLPGARDRHGLPESIRFWKTRLESRVETAAFRVGLLYGPSGSGKSSFLRAGLLPQLEPSLTTVVLNAGPDDTESRLLVALRQSVPSAPPDANLADTIAAIRRGSAGKVVIVLDQFEQLLAEHPDEPNAELLLALRQCDGTRVQALLLVRDDFWMAVTRCFDALEVRLAEGDNAAAIDLFDLDHARKVLAFFGRAYGKLPARREEYTPEQQQFLDDAVRGLADAGGRVICIRLVVFAEMVKTRSWDSQTLSALGGLDGVGVSFLEETFSNRYAPLSHRRHEMAARGVLQALLPPPGKDIRSTFASRVQLQDAAGYSGRATEFDDLMAILDGELRLITPADGDSGASRYQLTHDYLVPSLREWLLRKQRETRRGRAELLLSERAALWKAKPEPRFLPSLSEWLGIRTLTDPHRWNDTERSMMRRAGRRLAGRTLGVALLVAGLIVGVLAVNDRVQRQMQEERAASLVEKIAIANPYQLPQLVGEYRVRKEFAAPILEERLVNEHDERIALQLRFAKLADAPDQLRGMLQQLTAEDPLRVAGIVVLTQQYDQLESVIALLLSESESRLGLVLQNLQKLPGAKQALTRQLDPMLKEESSPQRDASAARLLLAQANLGDTALLETAMSSESHRGLQTRLLQLSGSLPINVQTLADIAVKADSETARRNAFLLLGKAQSLPPEFLPQLLEMYSTDPNAGVHAAIEYVLRQNGKIEELKRTDAELSGQEPGKRGWSISPNGHTMVHFTEPPYQFLMGDPMSDRKADKNRHQRRIERAFAIGSREVTVREFIALVPEHRKEWQKNPRLSPSEDCAVTGISWIQAALYCNELSRREGIPEDQWCYFIQRNDDGTGGFALKANFLELSGYRLPTESEWEFAARAGSNAARHFDNVDFALPQFAWFNQTSNGHVHPPGQLLPNEFGLFDMLGNASEWTLTAYDPNFSDYTTDDRVVHDEWRELDDVLEGRMSRVIRGGSYYDQIQDVRSARRFGSPPQTRPEAAGLRLARTIRNVDSQQK